MRRVRNLRDIQGVFASLKARGVSFQAAPYLVHRTPQSELWRLAEFTDPDGNHLALMSECTSPEIPGSTK